MRTIIAICLLMITATVQASSYNCSFDGGNLSIDSDNKKFTVNNNVYDIDGMARGKNDFLGTYTKPILLNNKNIRYIPITLQDANKGECRI